MMAGGYDFAFEINARGRFLRHIASHEVVFLMLLCYRLCCMRFTVFRGRDMTPRNRSNVKP